MNSTCAERLIRSIAAGLLALAWAGCTPQDEPPRRYQVPSESVAEPVPDAGAAAPIPPATLARTRLTYDLPEGWTLGKVGGMRKAAFVIQDGDRQVEVTAIDLVARGGDLLANVNRWRGQIQLGEIDQAELDKSLRRIQVDDVQGDYVELLGPEGTESRQAILAVSALRDGKTWFFKLSGDAELAQREKEHFEQFVNSVRFEVPEPNDSPSVSTEIGSDDWTWTYDTPEGWTPTETDGVRQAAFRVEDGEQNVNASFLVLPGSVERLLPNVNRWRRQIQLSETTQDELDKTRQPIQVAGVEGDYIELVGPEDAVPRQAMLVVVAMHEGQTWLFNLTGDAELALREKDRFQAFVRSVKFLSPDVKQDGD